MKATNSSSLGDWISSDEFEMWSLLSAMTKLRLDRYRSLGASRAAVWPSGAEPVWTDRDRGQRHLCRPMAGHGAVGSIGIPVNCEARIVDASGRETTQPNSPGELQLTSSQCFRGIGKIRSEAGRR